MGDIVLATQSPPATPSTGTVVFFAEAATKRLVLKDDAGRTCLLCPLRNYNTADVVANAADTYLTGSSLTVPTGLLPQIGTFVRWTIAVSKTASGSASPTWSMRVGTTGTVADTARLTFTGPSQTNAVDVGYIDILAIFRTVGVSGVLAGVLSMTHHAGAAGLANVTTPVLQVTSAAFDTTTSGLTFGVSVNPGSAATWTHQLILSEMGTI